MRPYPRQKYCANCGLTFPTHHDWRFHGCQIPAVARIRRSMRPDRPLALRLDAVAAAMAGLLAAFSGFGDSLRGVADALVSWGAEPKRRP